ncbi:hypothetical protein BELL_0500g00040 [Botrytis elliptica]|uniref:Enoyl reductase (ER) domain-containing protein n=1 Tax=Botrytis elliptica TaxID=278938 RepID=A0A4Z1JEN3_9HELO|nr:hypothetical protein EAE99_005441 [Botrytis elliptica]TGO72028.1 hypothetical protein BELL_0500g00040 [Botrytis elliptica]
MAQNKAAWIKTSGANPLAIDDAPIPHPGLGELVIKNAVVAINPVDWKIQDHGRYLNKYPFILGEDTAGTVEAVGEGVVGFQKGQRVIAHCHALMTRDPSNSAFQNYTLVTEKLTSALPDSLSFAEGAVLPLAISTASAGLFQKDTLNLPLPSATDKVETDNKDTILIWGGASSVGATAIQLAVAAGLKVITTASSQNKDFVKSIGAQTVIDYKSPNVVEEVANALRGSQIAGVFDAISETRSFETVQKILESLDVFPKVASVLPYDKPTEKFSPKYVTAFTIIQEPNQYVGEAVWKKFVPEGLANGKLQAKPEPYVVGHGLEDLQKALDIQRKGVSAKKVVVTL